MAYVSRFEHGEPEPLRSTVDTLRGWHVIEFGTDWCGHCQNAQPSVKAWVDQHAVTHHKVEDGKGRPLGRSFTVKLWPTLILLCDGEELARVVRPHSSDDFAAFDAVMTKSSVA